MRLRVYIKNLADKNNYNVAIYNRRQSILRGRKIWERDIIIKTED